MKEYICMFSIALEWRSLYGIFLRYSLCSPHLCFATMAANRFASLFDEELQGKYHLKIVTALKHTNKHIYIQKHLIY